MLYTVKPVNQDTCIIHTCGYSPKNGALYRVSLPGKSGHFNNQNAYDWFQSVHNRQVLLLYITYIFLSRQEQKSLLAEQEKLLSYVDGIDYDIGS